MRNLWMAMVAIGIAVAPAAAEEPRVIPGTDNVKIDLATRYDTEFTAGFDAIKAGKPRDAVTIFDKVIADYEARHTTKAPVYCADSVEQAATIGALKMMSGRDDEPEIEILGSEWCAALFGKGFALIDLKRSDEAVIYLQRAVEMAPADVHYLNELAEWYKSEGKWQRSYELFSQARDLAEQEYTASTKEIKARSLRGMAYNLIELGEPDRAEELYKQSLELLPGHQGALQELEYIRQMRAKGD